MLMRFVMIESGLISQFATSSENRTVFHAAAVVIIILH